MMSKLQSFIKSQQVGSSTAPPDTTSSEDDDDEDDFDEEDTANLGDDSHEQIIAYLTLVHCVYLISISLELFLLCELNLCSGWLTTFRTMLLLLYFYD